MPKTNDWMAQLHAELRKEIDTLSSGAKTQFAMIKPPPVPPIPRQERVQNFVNMPIQQAQAMAVQMGPDKWKEYMDQNLNDVAEERGSNTASQLAQFYQQSTALPQVPGIMQTDLESELMQLIQGNNSGGPEPANTGY